MKRLLDAIRHTHGPAARRREADRWTPERPAWMTADDALGAIYRTVDTWLAEGEITWAHLFMANSALWEPGDDDLPAGVVYSFDPWFERHPERLKPIGRRIYGYHESDTAPARPWERLVRDSLHTGYERPLHMELPPSLSGGRVVAHSSTVIHRAHLPKGYITGSVLPMLVQRARAPHVCVPVPSAFWPQELLQRW